jgi:hypothetical protein
VPINFSCPGCGKTLRVGDEIAGKLARCPDCGAVASIPAATSEPAAPSQSFGSGYSAAGGTSSPGNFSSPAPQPTSNPAPSFSDSNPSLRETAMHPGSGSGVSPSTWMMRTETGKAYGPVSKATLDEWYQQGRIASFHFLSSDNGQTWMAAVDAYPQLRQTSAAFQPSGTKRSSDNPFGEAPATTHAYSPYASPRSAMGSVGGGLSPGQGGLLLTFAIIGFACCPVFAIVSLILGIRELSEINAGRVRQDAKGLAMASVIISVISLLIWGGGFGIGVLSDMR